MRRATHLIMGLVLALVLSTTTATPVTAQPSIHLPDKEGYVGEEIEVIGEGFPFGASVLLTYDDAVVNFLLTHSDGTFTTKIEIPASVAGPHKVKAIRASDGSELAHDFFTLKPKLTLKPDSGLSGSMAIAKGTGYASQADIKFTWSAGAQVTVAGSGSGSSGCEGSFSVAITVSAEVTGEVTITAATGDYSASAIFTVAGPKLLSPTSGAKDVPLRPDFSWTPMPGATSYQFILATDLALPKTITGTPITVTSPNFQLSADLDYDTTYFWAVKVTAPTASPQSIDSFHTMAKPVAPPTPAPPVQIPPVQQITPAWIWAIVIIGAILVIAVIVLIVTTRRVP
jgi:hypothetical protein